MNNVWEKWKVLAKKIGNFQVSIIFSILYFLLVTPLGLLSNIFNDFLDIKQAPKWKKYTDNTSSLLKMKDQ